MINSNKKILVVEDETSLRSMLVTILQDEDYYVDSATNGEEAIELLKSNQYDLLATDLYMPKINGVELILYCQQAFPDLKIILLSGGGREIEAENGGQTIKYQDQKIVVNIFLKKPCDLMELLNAVESLMNT